MAIMVEQGVDIPEFLDGIRAPDGWRVEFVEGEITVSPPAGLPHNVIANELMYELNLHLRGPGLSYRAYLDIGYCQAVSCADTLKGNHLIPDVSVVTRPFTPVEFAAAQQHSNWTSCANLDLVVEVTGSNRTADVVIKVRAYGRMAIPHYVLIDNRDRVTTVFTKPTGDVDDPGYATRQDFPFGTDVLLPAPYPTLKTKSWQ